MDSRKLVLRQTAILALGLILCMALVVCVFALMGKFDTSVVLGAVAGIVLATGNFYVMAYVANLAADKAQAQDVAGGQKLISLSYSVRMAALLAALVLCAVTGWFHVVTLVAPLVFVRPILTVTELIHKKGGA